jgi:hypothetical protein
VLEHAKSLEHEHGCGPHTISVPRIELAAGSKFSLHPCSNECTYCAFRLGNGAARRRALTQEEIAREVTALVEQGHKRILMVSGEADPGGGFDYILDSIRTTYGTRSGRARSAASTLTWRRARSKSSGC